MISTPSQYNELLNQLTLEHEIALDTEADSLYCYFEKLCLIQIGLPNGFFLLDPLSSLPLMEFFQALEGKRLIFHDAYYDLSLLRRWGPFPDHHLFDTMIAARLCGETHLGLAALVEKYFRVTLSKVSRKANWAQRPLSSSMIDYALNDVRYLHQLAALFEEKLSGLGRLEWFYQSQDRMIRSTREIRTKGEEERWRLPGYSKLSLRSQALLRALWKWRDDQARQSNKPSFYILSNEELLQIAHWAPEKKVVPKIAQARRASFEEVLEMALSLPEEQWPKPLEKKMTRMTKEEIKHIQVLKEKRDKVALELGMNPSIIASKLSLELTVRDRSSSTLLPWQQQVLGIESPLFSNDHAS